MEGGTLFCSFCAPEMGMLKCATFIINGEIRVEKGALSNVDLCLLKYIRIAKMHP
jgi:hypothetical protein